MSRLLVVGLDGPEIADHAANVTAFPEIRAAFLALVAAWADADPE